MCSAAGCVFSRYISLQVQSPSSVFLCLAWGSTWKIRAKTARPAYHFLIAPDPLCEPQSVPAPRTFTLSSPITLHIHQLSLTSHWGPWDILPASKMTEYTQRRPLQCTASWFGLLVENHINYCEVDMQTAAVGWKIHVAALETCLSECLKGAEWNSVFKDLEERYGSMDEWRRGVTYYELDSSSLTEDTHTTQCYSSSKLSSQRMETLERSQAMLPMSWHVFLHKPRALLQHSSCQIYFKTDHNLSRARTLCRHYSCQNWGQKANHHMPDN